MWQRLAGQQAWLEAVAGGCMQEVQVWLGWTNSGRARLRLYDRKEQWLKLCAVGDGSREWAMCGQRLVGTTRTLLRGWSLRCRLVSVAGSQSVVACGWGCGGQE